MRFSMRVVALIAFCFPCLLTLPSCGILGQKEDIKRRIDFKGKDCMNDLAPKITRFMDGDLPESEWNGVWDCTNESLDTFVRFIDGSTPEGYTSHDVKMLLSNFLITNREVSDDLVSGLLSLKASIAGGDPGVVTRKQIDFLKELLQQVKRESGVLLPLLKARKSDPTPANLIRLGDAIAALGSKIADTVDRGGNRDFPREEADKLVNELERMNVAIIPREWIPVAFAAKQFLFAGSSASIEGPIWGELIRTGSKAGGLALAVQTLSMSAVTSRSQDNLDFRNDIAARVYSILSDGLSRHGGEVSLDVLDGLIDSLPDSLLSIKTRDGEGHVVDRGVAKAALRPFLGNMLQNPSSTGMTQDSIDLIYSLFLKWSNGDKHLQRIYTQFSLDRVGETAERFATAAAFYQGQLDEGGRIEVHRLARLALDYKPLFFGDDDQITFIPMNEHSLHNLRTIHWMNLVAEHLLYSYGSHGNRTIADLPDLERLVADFLDIGFEFRILDKNIPGQAKKRFVEADMFTFVSNGNDRLDVKEITYYLAYLVSTFNMGQRVRDSIDQDCRITNGPEAGSDPIQWPKQDASCFIRVYFQRAMMFWGNLPNFRTYYSGSSQDERNRINENIVAAGRLIQGRSWIGSFDTQGMGAVIHYIESLFTRFDKNSDQKLDLDETLTSYPMFKPVFQKIMKERGLPTDCGKFCDFLAKSIFTYTVKHGKEPSTKFPEVLKFVGWFGEGALNERWWNVDASRARLYMIIPMIQTLDAPGFKEPWPDPRDYAGYK